ncbi:MAG: hypothetical protein Q8N26_28830 [Myxococcales bacterium]|nr:hypothetical protein [Myxococcales bacterium]
MTELLALRKTPTPTARQALERLATDADVGVQRQALATLAEFPFEAEWSAALLARDEPVEPMFLFRQDSAASPILVTTCR